MQEFSQVFQDLLQRFFGLFITFVFGFITLFRLYDVFAWITYIWSSFCNTGVGVARDDVAIKF